MNSLAVHKFKPFTPVKWVVQTSALQSIVISYWFIFLSSRIYTIFNIQWFLLFGALSDNHYCPQLYVNLFTNSQVQASQVSLLVRYQLWKMSLIEHCFLINIYTTDFRFLTCLSLQFKWHHCKFKSIRFSAMFEQWREMYWIKLSLQEPSLKLTDCYSF